MITVRYGAESTHGNEDVLFVMSMRHEACRISEKKIEVDRGVAVVVIVIVFVAAANVT